MHTTMPPLPSITQEYSSFVCNPQRDGVWNMRIELSEKQITTLSSFLNIESYRFHRPSRYLFGRRRPSSYRYDDSPPVFLPRIFAYLRACIPQKERNSLPTLAFDGESYGSSFGPVGPRRSYRYIADMLTPPTHLGSSKRRRLSEALEIYRRYFLRCRIMPVPDNVGKIDVTDIDPLLYFQVAEELPALRISSPSEATLRGILTMLEAVIQTGLDVELTKIFSPENTLMGMYLPILQSISLLSVLKDKTAADNVSQALDEAVENRFVHAIRAIGISAEELLVEIYETYLREKAPEAPLGNILNDLGTRLQEVVQGVKVARESPLSAARKQIGKAMANEKKAANNQNVLLLAEQIQKNIIPTLEAIRQSLDDSPPLSLKEQKINLFPPQVQRCISELVILRNRVSHRVERAVSVATVGYVDTAKALRDYVILAKWWENERKQIDYKATRKVMIQDTVKRGRSQEWERDGNT